MKGLLLKDFYTLSGYRKQYLMVLGFFAVWSALMKSFAFLSMYVILLGGMMVITLMTMDETTHFNRYGLTMPISIRTMVKEKYLAFIICMVLGGLVSFLVEQAAVAVSWSDGTDEWVMIAALVSFFTIAYSVYIPVVYKYGVEKARYTYIVIMLLMAGIVLGLVRLTENVKLMESQAIIMLKNPSPGIGWICLSGVLLVLDAAAVVISYQISLKIVKNKEW